MPSLRVTSAVAFAVLVLPATSALAQKQGGTLRLYLWDNPPSASIHEEATISTVMPFMALFNNLILYDQHERLTTTETIRPELATSWAWDAGKTNLTFNLRTDVKWHDGKPFTAKDVVCTFDRLQDKSTDQFRKNPRKLWWNNLKEVTASSKYNFPVDKVSFSYHVMYNAFKRLSQSYSASERTAMFHDAAVRVYCVAT